MSKTVQTPKLSTKITLLFFSWFVLSMLIQAVPNEVLVFAQQTESNSPQLNTDNGLLRLTAIPPRLGEDLSLKASPGQTIQTSVRVKNSSQSPQTFRTLVEDFLISEDGQNPIAVNQETPSQWSMSSWMTVTPPINSVAPNESATINVLIEVPADALPGGRYAMIMHEPIASGDPNFLSGSSAGVSQRVGTLVYFLVDGVVNEEAYIKNVQINSFFENGPVPFSFEIDNRSDIHITPKVEAQILNMLGQTVETIAVEDSKNIFPYTSRMFDVEWKKAWGFGRYTVNLSASYGTSGQIARSAFSFWMFPIRIALAITVSFTFLLMLIIFVKNKVIKANKMKTQQIQMLEEKIKSMESQKVQKFEDTQN